MKLSTRIPLLPHRGATALFAAGALAGAAVFGAAQSAALGEGAAVGKGSPAASSSGPIGELAAPSPTGFADLAERVQPAVVFVTVEKPTAAAARLPRPPGFDMGPFERFFERMPTMPNPQVQVGSGFFVDGEGHIVTSDHVVAGAAEVTVTLHDGTRHEARVVGRDARTDLAVLRIGGGGPSPWLSFGDDGGARVGDWVVAVGNPFGFGGTVTAGILSARGRDIRSGGYGDFLQVDAPINRGSSGGPLFDTRGRVIGVNAAIYAPAGGNVGIGFAVPASIAAPVVAELIEEGRVSRGWLGVSLQPLTPEIAESLGMEKAEGVLVADVAPDSPAARAGILRADVVTAAGGRPMEDGKALAREIGAMEPGEEVVVTVVRKGEPREIRVELGDWPAAGKEAVSEAPAAAPASGPRLGVSLERRDGQLVIAGVDPGSPAAEARLRRGDVLLGVGDEPVAEAADVGRALRKAADRGREHALLLIERHGQPRFVAVRIEIA